MIPRYQAFHIVRLQLRGPLRPSAVSSNGAQRTAPIWRLNNDVTQRQQCAVGGKLPACSTRHRLLQPSGFAHEHPALPAHFRANVLTSGFLVVVSFFDFCGAPDGFDWRRWPSACYVALAVERWSADFYRWLSGTAYREPSLQISASARKASCAVFLPLEVRFCSWIGSNQ